MGPQRRASPPAATTEEPLAPEDLARYEAAEKALKAMRRPPGEQALSTEQYERLTEVIRRLSQAGA